MKRRVAFIGSKALGLRILRRLAACPRADVATVVSIDDSGEAGTRSRLDGIRAAAAACGARMYVAPDRPAAELALVEAKPDLCVVCGWYWLISAPTLASVPLGFMAIHHSRLPLFRGNAPVVWAMIRGEREIGVSLFRMTPDLDDGPLWAQGAVPIADDDYVGDVLARLEEKTVALFDGIIGPVLEGALDPAAQPAGPPSYCARRGPSDGLIDWSSPADSVYAFVRAQSDPYPGAFSYYNGRPMRIWRARRFPHPYYGAPGQLVRTPDGALGVVCGDHRALVLEEVEHGGVRGRAAELIRAAGSRLTSEKGSY